MAGECDTVLGDHQFHIIHIGVFVAIPNIFTGQFADGHNVVGARAVLQGADAESCLHAQRGTAVVIQGSGSIIHRHEVAILVHIADSVGKLVRQTCMVREEAYNLVVGDLHDTGCEAYSSKGRVSVSTGFDTKDCCLVEAVAIE